LEKADVSLRTCYEFVHDVVGELDVEQGLASSYNRS
jgi:hypothetical protein